MRTSIVVSTFLVVGAGAVSAGALNATNDMKGSDTIFEVTRAMITACSGATAINYLGGGSGGGETAMGSAAGVVSQQIAPMSKFVSTCASTTLPSYTPAGTESGLVIGLDGVDIVANTAAGGSAACNPNAGCTPDNTSGLALNTTVTLPDSSTYQFNSAFDVLAVLFAGMDHVNGLTYPARNCNSQLRNYLYNNYGKIFQNANCAGSCTKLQHIFRRDDLSGTTDVFRTLVGIPQPTGAVSTTSESGSGALYRTPFCNALVPNNFASPPPAKRTWWDTAVDHGSPVPAFVNVYAPDFQDFDPIRVPCVGTNNGAIPSKTVPAEQVCGREGNLGLVLTVVPTDKLATTDSFPTAACGTGKTKLAAAPKPFNPPAGQTYYRCPNGDKQVLAGQCIVPSTTGATGTPACLAGAANFPGFVFDAQTINGVAINAIDGRVYNAHLHGLNAGGFNYEPDTSGRELYGAFYRIHSTRSIAQNAADSNQYTMSCINQDATSQLGCLVAASPCSLAYAGGEAVAQNAGTAAVAVKTIPGSTACVQAFNYPMARKLYVNTLVGFQNVTDQSAAGTLASELALSKCFANTSGNVAPNDINSIIVSKGFIALPAVGTYPGNPFCEDFNESMLCSAFSGIANVDACTAGRATLGLPATQESTCGDGVVQQFEECDDGTVGLPATITLAQGHNPSAAGNGSSPTVCTKGCRLP